MAGPITPKIRMQGQRRDESDGTIDLPRRNRLAPRVFAHPTNDFRELTWWWARVHESRDVTLASLAARLSRYAWMTSINGCSTGVRRDLAPWRRARMTAPSSARRMSPTTARSKRHSARSASSAFFARLGGGVPAAFISSRGTRPFAGSCPGCVDVLPHSRWLPVGVRARPPHFLWRGRRPVHRSHSLEAPGKRWIVEIGWN
jgi:hypothetical protein